VGDHYASQGGSYRTRHIHAHQIEPGSRPELRPGDELGKGGRADDLRQRYQARWVYYDTEVFNLFHHTVALDELRRNPQLRPVFERGTVHVFQIKAATA